MSSKPPKQAAKKFEIENPPVRTQFLIFTLFGDFIWKRGGKIWTSSLLYLMKRLGMSERAVRSALSRMTLKGWLSTQKHGRRSQYSLTDEGLALMERGQQRIFSSEFTDWDHRWHLVVYSLPEKKRDIRHALRTQLSWLGFGSLAPGTWISPHHPTVNLENMFSELNVEQYVELFTGVFLGPSNAKELTNRCWDLEGLASQYEEFIQQFQDDYDKCLDVINKGQSLNLEDCFIRRFWLTHNFQSFPMKDPNLPTELLPSDWIGNKARVFFEDYHNLLGEYAGQFVDDVMLGNGIISAGD